MARRVTNATCNLNLTSVGRVGIDDVMHDCTLKQYLQDLLKSFYDKVIDWIPDWMDDER